MADLNLWIGRIQADRSDRLTSGDSPVERLDLVFAAEIVARAQGGGCIGSSGVGEQPVGYADHARNCRDPRQDPEVDRDCGRRDRL